MQKLSRLDKYNVAVPRYTSYPTVPTWNQGATEALWLSNISQYGTENQPISLYIHLPFCESLCTYCGCNKHITTNHNLETPYIKTLIQEWQIYRSRMSKDPIIQSIHLGGGTPTFFAAEQLKMLMETLFKTMKITEKTAMSFEAHPSSTTDEHLETLYSLGFRRLSIGVQDISPEILKAINRHQTTDQITHITNKARALGYTGINYDIIYGLPFQKPLHVMDTGNFVAENRPDRIAFYSYAHVPWKSKGQRAFSDADVPMGSQKQSLQELGHYLLSSAGYEAIAMDHYALPEDTLAKAYREQRLHRNFMGYTDTEATYSIGLGMSAISETPDYYVQVDKTLKGYQASIQEGKLPIITSHHMRADEKVFKKHITNLMCNGTTSWTSTTTDYHYLCNRLPRLDQLVEDGLVTYDHRHITATEIGHNYLRNICAAIDPKYTLDVSNRLYSKAI